MRLGKTKKTPAELGYRMPAEWEPHEATWIAWPHNSSDWPGKLTPIPWVYGEMVRKIASQEIVRILVNSRAYEAQARRILSRVGVDLSRIEFFRFQTNRGWTRDFGPLFVRREEPDADVAIARFRFNAWAKYPDWRKDDRIPERAAKALECGLFRVRSGGCEVILEGGSIDVNGQGSLLTTEQCLCSEDTQVRNPDLSRSDIEASLCANLGVRNVLWLGRGIVGDDTHGHVDDFCRFIGPGKVVLCREKNPSDSNYAILEENHERLEGMRLEDGSRMEIVALPMPEPLYMAGQRLPASYANFYITNAAVLVPTFNDPNDRIALGILGEHFQDRPVTGIHAVDLVWGLGSVHCLTQQQPAV